jgi:hypothetical protein
VPALDNDAAGYDPIKEAFELGGALMDSRGDAVRPIHMTKRDLQWQLHRILHSRARLRAISELRTGMKQPGQWDASHTASAQAAFLRIDPDQASG